MDSISDLVYLDCHMYEFVTVPYLSEDVLLGANSFHGVNIGLAQSDTFLSMRFRYGRLKITGITIRFDSSVTQHISLNNKSRIPTFGVAFYPHLIATNTQKKPLFAMGSAYFSTNYVTPQTHSWKFEDGYSKGETGGYGVWMSSDLYLDLKGQLSIAQIASNIIAQDDLILGTMRITYHCIFRGRLI